MGSVFDMQEREERFARDVDNYDTLVQEAQQVIDEMLGSYDYSTESLRAIEFCIDGFLANKVTVVAGPPGVGKTSLLVPLACVAAGLVADDRVKATLRRRVAYVTEDPEQVERILFGMRKHGLIECTDQEFRFWFDIIPAVRASSDRVGTFVKRVREEKTVEAPPAQNCYMVEPLIVLDTSSATIDLDSENDNSEAGKAIALIKQNLGSACLWLIAHTAKVASKSDVAGMSARGAGAFEGDANAVAYIVNESDVRFMVLGKRRFEADFSELRFESESHYETVQTPWGTEQRIWYRYGIPCIAEKGERESMKSQIKEEATVEQRLVMHRQIMEALNCGDWMSGAQVRSKVKGKTETITGMLKTLVSTGVLEVKQGPKNATLYCAAVPGTTGNN